MMDELKDVTVKVEKLDRRYLEWRQSDKMCEKSKGVFSEMVDRNISNLIRSRMPEIDEDFPAELPSELQFSVDHERRLSSENRENETSESSRHETSEFVFKEINQSKKKNKTDGKVVKAWNLRGNKKVVQVKAEKKPEQRMVNDPKINNIELKKDPKRQLKRTAKKDFDEIVGSDDTTKKATSALRSYNIPKLDGWKQLKVRFKTGEVDRKASSAEEVFKPRTLRKRIVYKSAEDDGEEASKLVDGPSKHVEEAHVGDLMEASEDDDVVKPRTTRKRIVFESEGEDEDVDPPMQVEEVQKVAEPALKRQKTSSLTQPYADDDLISLGDSIDDLDDLDGLDDVFIPIGKPPSMVKVEFDEENIEPDETVELSAVQEFDMNTNAILKATEKSLNDDGKQVLKRFFADVCPDFLDNVCSSQGCQFQHRQPDLAAVHAELEKSPLKDIDEAYGVASKHAKLFELSLPMFAEMFIKRASDFEPASDQRIARLIMDCERTARSHQLYRPIVTALIFHGKMPSYKAIQLLIKHHTNSEYAQDAIMSMIVEEGPHLIRFMDYLRFVSKIRPLPNHILDKIISNCVIFQDVSLPMFCLDNLIATTRSTEQIGKLNKANLEKFMELHTYLVETNETREEKLLALIQKMVPDASL